MHGVQLRPNSTPSIGAPASPARGRIEGRRIRPVTGMRSNTPANSSPSTIVSTPKTWVSPTLCRSQQGAEPAEGDPLAGEHGREAQHEQRPCRGPPGAWRGRGPRRVTGPLGRDRGHRDRGGRGPAPRAVLPEPGPPPAPAAAPRRRRRPAVRPRRTCRSRRRGSRGPGGARRGRGTSPRPRRPPPGRRTAAARTGSGARSRRSCATSSALRDPRYAGPAQPAWPSCGDAVPTTLCPRPRRTAGTLARPLGHRAVSKRARNPIAGRFDARYCALKF